MVQLQQMTYEYIMNGTEGEDVQELIVEGIRKDHKGLLYFDMRKDEEGSKTCRRNALGK